MLGNSLRICAFSEFMLVLFKEYLLTPEIPSMEAPSAGGEDGTKTFFGDEGISKGAPPGLFKKTASAVFFDALK